MLKYSLLLLFAVIGLSYSFTVSISPGIPAPTDSIWVIFEGYLGGGDLLIDSGVSRRGNEITAHLSIDPCTGMCPLGIRAVTVRLPLGILAAGDYTLISRVFSIYDTVMPPDTVTETDTIAFTVSAADSIPRLVALYQTQPGYMVSPYADSTYYYRNGDTLSVTAVFQEQCCAKYAADLTWAGDTLVITAKDTSGAFCDCMGVWYLTAAVRNIPGDGLAVKFMYKTTWVVPRALAEFTTDYSRTAVSLVLDNHGSGWQLFLDSSWFSYELNSPLLDSLNVLGFAPNPDFPAPDTNRMYLDSVTYNQRDSAPELLEEFERYIGGDWSRMTARDGSYLSQDTIGIKLNHILEIKYGNFLSGNTHASVSRQLLGQAVKGVSQVWVTASLRNPALPVNLEIGQRSTVNDQRVEIEARPNPFNPATQIKYRIAEVESRIAGEDSRSGLRVSAFVNLSIYDTRGALVETLVNARQPAGVHTVTWKAAGLSAGIYYARLLAGEKTAFRKIAIVR